MQKVTTRSQAFEGGKGRMMINKSRLWVGLGAAMAGVLATAPISWAATALFLSHTSGQGGQYNAIAGSGFAGGGTDTITITSTKAGSTLNQSLTVANGGIVSDTTKQIVFQLPGTTAFNTAVVANGVYDTADSGGAEQAYTIQIAATGTSALPFDMVTGGPTDSKPHGDYSTSTDFCLSCHMVHEGNDGAQTQHLYALLGTDSQAGMTYPGGGFGQANFPMASGAGSALPNNGSMNTATLNGGAAGTQSPTNVVVEVCQNCHSLGVADGTINNGIPAGYLGPDGGFGGETVATTAHYNVYKNTANVSHPMGAFEPPDSVGVNLAYLNLNTAAYQSSGYNTAAPTASANATGSDSGLYCGSCHSPHGDYSANAWLGWDAAQFSENYGNNWNGDSQGTTGLPGTEGTNLWLTALGNGYNGAVPLTNALLIDNPGHQNGINNGVSNPNVPSSSDVTGNFAGTSVGATGTSMNFSPFMDPQEVGGSQDAVAALSTYVGSVVDPMFGSTAVNFNTNGAVGSYGYTVSGTPTGATDDTLSNFCMGCHNLNGGAYSEMQGHPAHPIQAVLSPDSAGVSTAYNVNDAGNYDHILNGCTECHGSPEVMSGSFASGFSMNPANGTNDATNLVSDVSQFDFPHTTPGAVSYLANDDILLKGTPDGVCLSCHDNAPKWSSLP